MADSNIKKIKIISGSGTNIFTEDKYIIPLYQRAFAWEYAEIAQMIEDIEYFEADNYYLGTLIVEKRKDGKFEVIDGQQRLTALYLLLTVLEIPFENDALSFEYREKSDNTLDNLKLERSGKAVKNDWREDADESDEGILSGFEVVLNAISIKKTSIGEMKSQLKKVNLVQVIVPPNTDLNKYFEIMNNRGEQLEQQDIVKAHLMEMIGHNDKRDAFARIWEACSDMSGYVQMHFDVSERKHYFGFNWEQFPYDSIGYYLESSKTDRVHRRPHTIGEIADSVKNIQTDIDNTDEPDEDNIRFESFLTFRHFLLHVLKIFEMERAGGWDSENEWSGDIDDKKLIKRFEEAFPRGQDENEANKAVIKFGFCLLQCRFLFDNYMLKREFKGDDTEGKWSLKTLKTSRQKKYGSLSANYDDAEDGVESRMLQSMMRVTYTSPLSMHWVTDFLAWLYFNDYSPENAVERLETFAKKTVSGYLEERNISTGLATPHIVFNYLDYLLWQEIKSEREKRKFQFEFRNSVEHWYPQKPIDSNVEWEDGSLHHFGNLCIVSSGLNSKFSNNLPMAKKANFHDNIERQSLKLRIMADKTSGPDAWTKDTAIAHGNDMIAKLKEAVL